MILKEICSGAELALLLGITERHVQGLAVKGVLTKADRGQYRVQLSVSGYIEYLRKGQPDQAESKRLEKARTKLIEEKAELARMDREEREGRLVDAAGQRNQAFKVARTTRNAIQGIPDRVSGELVAADSLIKVVRILEKEIDASLHLVADILSKDTGCTLAECPYQPKAL